jgi:outer membrane protein OmpA-like peptidoglycan-associated protein
MKIISLAASIALATALGACGTMGHRAPAVASVCGAREFNIYFDDSETQLSPEAREAIGAVDHSLEGCRIERVRIVGLADAPGDPNENMELSEQRAQTVATYLQHTTRWPRSAYELVARGENNATNSDGIDRPMRRRAHVTVTPAVPHA